MLGPLEAWHDGAPVPLGDQQQRFILVVLLLNANKPVSVERLTDVVWPGQPERRTLVRGYINKLRKAFREAGELIETTATGYLLRVEDDQIDALRFDRLRAQAERADDPLRKIELLRTAVDLWRGRFLEDVDVDRVGGTEVISPDDDHLDAVGDLAELELAAGDYRSTRNRLRRIVRNNPDKQRHAELLMRALLASGDRVDAMRVFRDTANALTELGMQPGPVLRNLAARAERGEPASSLPSRPGGFTGRAAEYDVIASAAAGGRAVWLSGAPGVGKTGLAVEAAHRLRGGFPDGQLLVRLNGFTPNVPAVTVGDALTQLLLELGVPAEQVPASVGRKITLYQQRLYGTRTLVVLDNAESADQVRALLPEAPGCFAIVTSRRVGEPDTGENIRLAPLPHEEAAALFRTLAGPRRVHGRSPEVAEVVRLCGHLPMPVVVAAALFRRHERWPLEHLVRLLQENGPWQADDSGAAAVRASYRQLGGPQQEMFRLLGHLPGPHLAVPGAAALANRPVNHARAVLDELHEVCLLEELAPERYQMLDPLKEFAAAEPTPGVADALVRLLDFYLVTLTRAVGTAYPFDQAQLPATDRSSPVSPTLPGEDAALAWIVAERDNLVATIRRTAHDHPEHAWRMAVLIWRYFNTTNQFEDWIETTEIARQVVSADPDNHQGQAHVLLRLATAQNRLGELTEALELAGEALPRWRRLGDIDGEAATLVMMAISSMRLGDHDEAITNFEAALAKYEQCGDVRGQAHALSMLGYLNEERGNLDVALRQHEAAVPMLREMKHVGGLAHALSNRGCVRRKLGQLPEALADHTEALRLAGEVDDECTAAYALTDIGTVHRLAGRLTEAANSLEQATKIATTLTDVDLRIQLHLERGATARARGDQAGAHRFYSAALDLATTTESRNHRAHAARGVAQSLHALNRHEQAVQQWNAAEAEFTALGQREADEVHAERAAFTCACGVPD